MTTGAQAVLRNGAPLEELRLGKSNMPALSSSTGEFNAHDKKELIRQLSGLMQAVSSGDVVMADPVQREADRKKRQAAVAAASESSEKWASLGSSLAQKITETRNRDGFMRRLCIGQSLGVGENPFINMQMWDAVSIVAVNSTQVGFQTIRNKRFMPTEFEVTANVAVEGLEMQQVGADVLDEAYNQGVDSIMVKEDRIWKQAADRSVGLVNPLSYIAGNLTVQMLAKLRTTVSDWNLPATNCLISNDYWSDIIGSNDFASFLDPVTKYDLALHGYLGTLIGLNLITDAFRTPTQKVLNRGEIYVVAAPEHHAAYTDRGGVTSKPTDGTHEGSSRQGWFLQEYLSFTLGNPRSVAKGVRR